MQRFAPVLTSLLLGLALIAGGGLVSAPRADDVAHKWIVVPPGNRSATQPDISASSIKRTADTHGDFESKYRQIYDQLASDHAIIDKIVKTAALYDIDPIHIIGAIVGEHTYNVDVFDSLQGYYIKALAYLDSAGLSFGYKNEPIEDFVARPEFAECVGAANDYDLWTCRDRIWRDVFRGKTVGGVAYPDDRFERVFFQPYYAGQTFGLGQLSPLAALSVSDLVHARAGLPPLDMRQASKVYAAVMDPDKTLNYMAALIRTEIDVYRAIANLDIAGNPGLTATLYNTGEAAERAAKLAADNRKRRAAGLSILYPRENYYGWLINDRLADLEKLLPAPAPVDPPTLAPTPKPKKS